MSEPIRVLHVDDDRAFLALSVRAMERQEGIEVSTEADATAVLGRLDDEAVDCVVSDYDMPATTGLELLAAVRECDDELPFVLFTGKGSEEIASEAISAGVTDYIRKQAGLGQFTVLVNRIERAVEQRRTAEQLRTEKRLRERILAATPVGIVVHGAPLFDDEGGVDGAVITFEVA